MLRLFLKEKYMLNIDAWTKKLWKSYQATTETKEKYFHAKIYQYFFGDHPHLWMISVIIIKKGYRRRKVSIEVYSEPYDLLLKFNKKLQLTDFSRPQREAKRKEKGIKKASKTSSKEVLVIKKALTRLLREININAY
ncbi:MAG: hypothetical protein GXP45_05155 [bacterium]|nr:hypothetical protein [bacterium]